MAEVWIEMAEWWPVAHPRTELYFEPDTPGDLAAARASIIGVYGAPADVPDDVIERWAKAYEAFSKASRELCAAAGIDAASMHWALP